MDIQDVHESRHKAQNLVHDSSNFSSSPCLKSKSLCKAACLALGGKYFWKKEAIKQSGLSMEPGGNLLNQALASPFSEKGNILVTKYLRILKSPENKALIVESSFICATSLSLSVPQKGSFSTMSK